MSARAQLLRRASPVVRKALFLEYDLQDQKATYLISHRMWKAN